jgi:DNA gyrase subunit A
LAEAEKRAHILEGLLKALDHLDEVIELIRASKDPELARVRLMERFEFSEPQATAILNMRLQRLTGLEREKIVNEYQELLKQIEYYKSVLSDVVLRMSIIKDELLELKAKYGEARRSTIVLSADDIDIEDMIPNDEMVVTVSNEGYIKRTPLREYRTQNRGGVGSKGVGSKEADFPDHLFIAKNHNYLLFFTKLGKLFWLKTYKVPEGSKTAKGRPLQNLIQIEKEDRIQAVINVETLTDEDFVNNHYLIMATEMGVIKKTALEAYSRPRTNGINAINVNDGDTLLDVKLTDGNSHIILAVRSGRAICFHESTVRPMGRTATGVRGISLDDETDKVIGLVCISDPTHNLLVVSEQGYGKRSDLEDYRITNRGGKGVKTMNITDKTGSLISIKNVTDLDELMIINKSGITIRMAIADIRVMGRATQGVRLIRLNEGDEIASVAKIERIAGEEAEDASEMPEQQSDLEQNHSEE